MWFPRGDKEAEAAPGTRTLIVPWEGDVMHGPRYREFLFFPKPIGLVAAPSDENASTEDGGCKVSARVRLFHRRCQWGWGPWCPGGSGAMAQKPLDTAGFLRKKGIITTFVRSLAPELPLFHADQI